ncbi:MAG: hypothetical protein WCE92_09580, partial [Nitrososphaeraceae archaeon]
NKVTYPTCSSSRITAKGVKIRSTYTAYDFKNFDIIINHVVEILVRYFNFYKSRTSQTKFNFGYSLAKFVVAI